jgi:GIY-YIG catalytic domain
VAEIYALFSCRDGRVRYIGQTQGLAADRFEQHKRSYSGSSAELRAWISGEWRAGYPVECMVMQWCEDELRFEAEIHWMGYFSGLLNKRMNGQTRFSGLVNGHRHRKVPKIAAYLRR